MSVIDNMLISQEKMKDKTIMSPRFYRLWHGFLWQNIDQFCLFWKTKLLITKPLPFFKATDWMAVTDNFNIFLKEVFKEVSKFKPAQVFISFKMKQKF
jgi:hypothetical protein